MGFAMHSRRLLVALCMLWPVAELAAQTTAPAAAPRGLEVVWGSPAHCPGVLERINRHLADPGPDDLVAIGRQFETGECVVRDELRASQFYGEAARRGSSAGARRLAVLFGTGRGVPQSYANAGAWVAGKGASDERIEPWDYSIGRAYTVIATTLDGMVYPLNAWPADFEATLAVEVDTQLPGRLSWRFTGERAAPAEALRGPLDAAFSAAARQALERLAPVEARYLVAARVTLPIAVRRASAGAFVVTEHDPLLR